MRDGLERLRHLMWSNAPKLRPGQTFHDSAQAATTNGSKGKSPAMDSVSALMNFWKPPEKMLGLEPESEEEGGHLNKP